MSEEKPRGETGRRVVEAFGGLILIASGVIYCLVLGFLGGACAQFIGDSAWTFFVPVMIPGALAALIGVWVVLGRPGQKKD